jgi:hypothetical protein
MGIHDEGQLYFHSTLAHVEVDRDMRPLFSMSCSQSSSVSVYT